MKNPEKLGRDTERDLFFLHVESPQTIPTSLKVPVRHFVCLLVWDSEQESADEISRVAEVLLSSGCVYFCTWGAGCERAHDIIDEVCIGPDPDPADGSVIMTTWHNDETLDDALWFFLQCTWADKHYEDSCRSALAVLIGSDGERASRIRYALKDPKRFLEEVPDVGE